MCYKVILILSLFVFISGNCLYASPKKILALYKSNENTTSSDNPVLNHLEKYLKDLGYDVDYRMLWRNFLLLKRWKITEE